MRAQDTKGSSGDNHGKVPGGLSTKGLEHRAKYELYVGNALITDPPHQQLGEKGIRACVHAHSFKSTNTHTCTRHALGLGMV